MNTAQKRSKHGIKSLFFNDLGLKNGHKNGCFCVLSSLFLSQTNGKGKNMEYEIEVIELHEIKKTYFVTADNKKDARIMARENNWHDASGDEPTGIIRKTEIKSIIGN